MTHITADDVEFDLVRSAIYHGARMHFLDRMNRWMMFIVVFTGTAATASAALQAGIPTQIFGVVGAGVAAANIAFGFSNRARDHDFLRRTYYGLLAKLVDGRQTDPAIAEKVHVEMLRASATEPPPLRALDAIAYNAALDGLGRDKKHRIAVTPWQSLLRQIYPFNGTDFAVQK